MTSFRRLNTVLGSLVERLTGPPSQHPRPSVIDAPGHDSGPRALISSATLGVILLAGHRRLDVLLEAVAAWGEVQDLTWIE